MWLQIYLSAAFIGLALSEGDDTPKRSPQIPFVADAVGNSLPPPSELPAKVGSPSNLLTPDRYEFYTFDESGELVKRLMTLEEIQTIVAAGEGNDGHMVTFAQDEKPTIAFNFTQPPFTKVHSVVTNVQNVLKSQIEAQKNNPTKPLSFDTPDVTNSWSMILPSIFGNTGVDIVPDKLPSTFGTPETETIDIGTKPNLSNDNSDTNALSKEEADDIDSIIEETTENLTTQSTSNPTTTTTESTTTTTTTTKKPLTTTITEKPMTTTSSTTTVQPITTTTTTTTKKTPTSTATTVHPVKLSTTTTSNPIQLSEPSKSSYNQTFEMISSSNPNQTLATKNPDTTSKKHNESGKTSQISALISSTTEKSYIVITKPKSTLKPSTSTKKATKIRATTINTPVNSFSSIATATESITKNNEPHLTVTTYRPSSSIYFSSSENPKLSVTIDNIDGSNNENGTTLTTQSISPSTAHSTSEKDAPTNHEEVYNSKVKFETITDKLKNPENINQDLNLTFDVAQSLSQIASDLGNNFAIQNENDGLDAKVKENGDFQILDDLNETLNNSNSNSTFIKISTINPAGDQNKQTIIPNISPTSSTTGQYPQNTLPTEIPNDSSEPTTSIDPVIDLSESMIDLMSQVVDQEHHNIIKTTTAHNLPESSTDSPLNRNDDMDIITTLMPNESVNKSLIKEEPNTDIEISTDRIQENYKNEYSLKQNTTIMDRVLFEGTTVSSLESSENQKLNEINNITITRIIDKVSTAKLSNSKIEPGMLSNLTIENQAVNSNTTNSELEMQKIFKEQKITNKSQEYFETVKLVPIISQNVNKTISNSEATNNKSEIAIKEDLTLQKSQVGQSNNTSNLKNDTLSKFVSHQAQQVDILQKPQKVSDSKKKVQKVNIDEKEYTGSSNNNSWKLVSTVPPPKNNNITNENQKPDTIKDQIPEFANDPSKEINLDGSKENQGLEVTIKNLGEDVYQFTDLCNELAFRYWNAAVENLDKKRSFVLSPYSITSMLAMMFMGARGATSGEMNEILKLDDMVTFNPHFTLKNISDSIETSPETGVAVSAFVRELYSDRSRGKLLTFYKERAQHFYNGHVEEINFKLINDIIRRRTNLLVKRYTWGKISEYIKTNNIAMKPPLAAFSANVFETDCTGSSVDGRDGEMYFVVSPSVRQRRLVPVPAVVYRAGFLAGYDPVLDATAAALGTTSSTISTVLLMPGQQGNIVHADDLERLERKLLESIPTAPEWYRLLRALLPRPKLELQIPRFSHRSVFNVSSTLRGMGLKDIFDPKNADLGGLNGPSKDLYLSDMIQTSTFVTCGEGSVGEQHHIEEYPELSDADRRRRNVRWTSGWEEPRDYQRAFHDPHDVGAALLPLHLRPRQARLPSRTAPPQPARLKFDRPFLYFVRHNPSGMILYVGRYNPRLLP